MVGAAATSATGAIAAPALAADDPTITTYTATVRVNPDGSLHVAEAATYDFGGTRTESLDRILTTREQYDATNDRVYVVSDVVVDAVQTDVEARVVSRDRTDTFEIDFAEPQTDKVTVTFDYVVDGAVAETADGLEVRWPVVQGFSAPIDRATVQWNAPNAIWLSCLAGSPGSSRPCTTSQLVDVPAPTMTQVDLSAGGEMVGILGLDAGAGVAAEHRSAGTVEPDPCVHGDRSSAAGRARRAPARRTGCAAPVVDPGSRHGPQGTRCGSDRCWTVATGRSCSRHRAPYARVRWAPSSTSTPT